MCGIKQTAGRLQVEISFPSASLLIKQLNGQKKKVVLGVKYDERKIHTHTHTHSMYLILVQSYRIWLSNGLIDFLVQSLRSLTHTSTSVLQQNISAKFIQSHVM